MVRKWRLTGVYCALWRLLFRLRRHYTFCGASRLRCWYRFTSTKAAQIHSWFFFKPRNLTFTNPKTRFRMRNGCSTFDLTRDLVRFFLFCNSSTWSLYLVRLQVMSWA